jgi:hypothetical protein
MKDLSNRLIAIVEAWKQKGDKSEYGKKEGLPPIDYWRRVGNQNIGFLGKEGAGRPITGFSKNRSLLYDKVNKGSGETAKWHGVFDNALRDVSERGGISAEEYKDRKASAKASFDTIFDDALAESGMSKAEFDKILGTESNRDPRIAKVFQAARSKMLEANTKKFGAPAVDGSSFGLSVNIDKGLTQKARKNGVDRAMVEWQTLFAHSLSGSAGGATAVADKIQGMISDYLKTDAGNDLKEKIRKAVADAKAVPDEGGSEWKRMYTARKIISNKLGYGFPMKDYKKMTWADIEALDADKFIAWLDGKEDASLTKTAKASFKILSGSSSMPLRGTIFQALDHNTTEGYAIVNKLKNAASETVGKGPKTAELDLKWGTSERGRAHFKTSGNPPTVQLHNRDGANSEFEKSGTTGGMLPEGKSGYHKSVMFHELSHWAEYLDKELLDASLRFLQGRVGSERPKNLKSMTGANYDYWETAFSDKFSEVYVGKIYDGASEVTSVASECLAYPEKMAALYRDDRDLFYHVCGVVFGSFKKG